MKLRTRIIAVTLFSLLLPMSIQAQSELPLNQKKLSDRALVIWAGDYMQMIDVVALTTQKGIVVIETSIIRSEDARIRQVIEKKFGRKDFKYLINTHYHHDHTAGNQVYADATIIGHKTVPAGMRSELTGEGLKNLIEKFHTMSKDWKEKLEQAEPDSKEYHFFREGLILLKNVIPELQDGFIPTYPTVLFEKSMILDMGDITVELYSVPGTHTESDIFIFVPEEGLVAVGDMWPDQVLPYLRKEENWDLDIILENWGRIVDSGREIKYVNMAHSDMFLSIESFKQQYNYLKTLWNGLQDLHHRGLSLEGAKEAYTIERDFPYFKDRWTEIRGINIHENNIEAMWERLAQKKQD
jgi:glyoxylase-like metal-dependent hydrolase (beta-lactamase superfamily II)